MASLPSPTQVAGAHLPIYEAYYAQIDPTNQGTIAPVDAAKFLKKSKLSDIVLGKIWDLSDPTSRGFLTKQGFFVALKLCALAQSGKGISMDNITATDVPQPKMGDVPKIPNSKVNDWAVKPAEKAKYDQLFDSLQPINGVIPGKKVRGVLMESKLPVDMLGKIWDLADMDQDGSLSRHEFMIAMHLVYKALEKYTIPNTLPPELMPPGKRKESLHSPPDLIMPAAKPPVPPQPAVPSLANIPPHPSRPPLPPQPQPIITQQPTLNNFTAPPPIIPPMVPIAPVIKASPVTSPVWVVTAEEKLKSDALFARTDLDRDGFVSGPEIKDVFLQSGVPQHVLALIWGLCDMSQTGKLNNEQFALAMWFIQRKLRGIDPPAALTPEMVPPSSRSVSEVAVVEQANNLPHSTPELDMLAADIRELSMTRTALEGDIAQKEAELKVKEVEVRSLQSELDTLAATLRQLESQKGEAQKRLNDLKSQKATIELELSQLIVEVETEQTVVEKLRVQADEQELALRSQESELSSKKQELESLKQEEQRLEKLQEDNRKMLDNLAQKMQESQLQISKVKAKVSQLEEAERQMSDAVAACEAAVAAGDASQVVATILSLGPDHRDEEISRLTANPEPEPVVTTTATFNGDDAFDADFSNDAFSNQSAFESADPFGSAFGASKPVASVGDPFGAAFGAPVAKADPFDPFGDSNSRVGAKTPADQAEEKDPFGCDPFANLHAPERPTHPPARPESPSPALPPKKAKQPPPRPAPPRPAAPSMRAAPVPPTPSPDPFASSSGFDNFANFDGKFSNISGNNTNSIGRLRAPPPVTTSSSSASPSPVAPPSNRYESFEFTEDPFKNYRYEDVFSIADPFSDSSDLFTPPSEPSLTDTFEARFPKSDAFDVNFTDNDPFTSDLANGNNMGSLFNGKDAFSDSNDNFSGRKPKNDPFAIQDKVSDKKTLDLFGEDMFGKKKSNDNISAKPGQRLLQDDVQLAWAAQESIRLEEERRVREQQEKDDLEYAIALSKKETEKKTSSSFKDFLRRGKQTPTT